MADGKIGGNERAFISHFDCSASHKECRIFWEPLGNRPPLAGLRFHELVKCNGGKLGDGGLHS